MGGAVFPDVRQIGPDQYQVARPEGINAIAHKPRALALHHQHQLNFRVKMPGYNKIRAVDFQYIIRLVAGDVNPLK